jgi:E3 ubiquitin-protein ligase MARCH6
MEWLSHSQKKYCELCKTSFRFTKLYHPAMPSRIPTSIFLRRAAVHVLKLFMTWCRAVLVGVVWVVLLPW